VIRDSHLAHIINRVVPELACGADIQLAENT
jgi:hypothetical protein